jgi:copper resistance protein C
MSAAPQRAVTGTGPRPGRLGAQLAVLVAVALGLLSLTVVAAAGHADVEGSSPEPDEHLDAPASQVRVWFDGPVEPVGTGLQVKGPDGIRVDRGDAAHGDGPHELRVSLPDGLPSGHYTAEWRVQAGDSHAQEGSWRFTVAGDDGGDPASRDTGADEARDADDSAHGSRDHEDAEGAAPASSGRSTAVADEVVGDTRLPAAQLGLAGLAGLAAAGGGVLLVRRDDAAGLPPDTGGDA